MVIFARGYWVGQVHNANSLTISFAAIIRTFLFWRESRLADPAGKNLVFEGSFPLSTFQIAPLQLWQRVPPLPGYEIPHSWQHCSSGLSQHFSCSPGFADGRGSQHLCMMSRSTNASKSPGIAEHSQVSYLSMCHTNSIYFWLQL